MVVNLQVRGQNPKQKMVHVTIKSNVVDYKFYMPHGNEIYWVPTLVVTCTSLWTNGKLVIDPASANYRSRQASL